jgi:hypothetical protein
VSQEDGSYLETNIPFHIEFIRKRKQANQTHFAQVVRLVKFWVRNIKRERKDFKFKSFMVELILSHLADQGLNFSDYPEALQNFFSYVARSNLRERIAFDDYYSLSAIKTFSEPIQIIDPVNEKTNASRLYTNTQVI